MSAYLILCYKSVRFKAYGQIFCIRLRENNNIAIKNEHKLQRDTSRAKNKNNNSNLNLKSVCFHFLRLSGEFE